MRRFSVMYVIFFLLFIFESAMAQSTDEAEVIVCDDSFEPVCSSQGDTYANQCFANLDGAEIVSEGVCNDPTLQCSLEYNPVCGIDEKTYDNACMATVAGIEIVKSGICGGFDACEQEITPVCGINGQTYKNRCIAASNRMIIESLGV